MSGRRSFVSAARNMVLNLKCVYFKDQRNLAIHKGRSQCLFVNRACLWESLYASLDRTSFKVEENQTHRLYQTMLKICRISVFANYKKKPQVLLPSDFWREFGSCQRETIRTKRRINVFSVLQRKLCA